ncbi:MAG: hypothetical protein COB26_02680 [Piscirickettsiaceae bacterium]|nr:MAG: hypothetical protein COB89_00255 [Piscirickettsiaceae bacterium]PCI70981.1 MAG: hypothetical protein COB26_02680 [Piscirickettsiaceae bacterium]
MSSITYTLRKADIVEFNEYHARMNGAYGKSITRHQIIWPAVIVIVALFIVMSSNQADNGVYLLVGAFVWSIGVPAWIKKRFHQHVLASLSDEAIKKATGEYSLEARASGLIEINPSGEKKTAWEKIDRIERSKHHIYLYMSEDAALIIPKEMVSEDSDLKEFNDDLIKFLKKSKGIAS